MLAAAYILSKFAAENPTNEFSIPSFFTMNYEQIGGFSLFLALCLLIVVGAFREWWVPGGRYRRLEDSAAKQSETLATTSDALREQIQANEITKHFFEKTVPKRGEPSE